MVNEVQNRIERNNDRLSMRHSLVVWVAGAVLGWVVAVTSVWTTINTTDRNIAENTPINAEQLEQIMPAAGDKKKTPEE